MISRSRRVYIRSSRNVVITKSPIHPNPPM
jgi:hypothetical protein